MRDALNSDSDSESLDDASRLVLQLQPDSSAAWTIRKSLLKEYSDRSSLDDELRWVSLVLTSHPKSGDAWTHRKNIIDRLVEINDQSLICKDLVFSEISNIEDQTDRHPHHYYAWAHWGYIFEKFPCFLSEMIQEVESFFRRILVKNPTHYGVYHYLIRWGVYITKDLEISSLLPYLLTQVEAVPFDFWASESFCQFLYASLLVLKDFPLSTENLEISCQLALSALPGEGEWPHYFRNKILGFRV